MTEKQPMNYQTAGVDSEQKDQAMQLLGSWVKRSFDLRSGEVQLPLGYFANVIDVGNGMGIAVSTDGVGTKILVAEMNPVEIANGCNNADVLHHVSPSVIATVFRPGALLFSL